MKYYADYFSMKLVKTFEGDLDPNKNYLFCSHPHGEKSAVLGKYFLRFKKVGTLYHNQQ